MSEVPHELIEQTFQLYTDLSPEYVVAKEKLQRPPVKAILDAFKIASDFTRGAFPPANLIRTEFPAEQKQERQDYIAQMIDIVKSESGRDIQASAKAITGGKEVEFTLHMLIALFETAKNMPPPSQKQDTEIVEERNVVQEVPQQAYQEPEPVFETQKAQFSDDQFSSEPQNEDPTEELIQYTFDLLENVINLPQISNKALLRPPVKILQEIFTAFHDCTNSKFPTAEVTVREEFSKEQKEERQSYIESIIKQVIQYSGENLSVQAKAITGGKQVAYTLYLLITMCRIARKINNGTFQEPVSQSQQNVQDIFSQPSPQIPDPIQEQEQPQGFAQEPVAQQQIYEIKHDDQSEKQRQIDEEEDQRRYAEARRKQQEIEEEQSRRLTNVFSEAQTQKATFNRPPPSQQTKRQQNIESNVVITKKYIEDSDSEKEEELPEQQQHATGFGAFTDAAQTAQNEFQNALGTDQAPTKQINSSNQKLVNAISDSIRRIIPFSKATSFLEEHLVRMRQDLVAASDDVDFQMKNLNKAVNLEGKGKSVLDAKVRSLSDQGEQIRASFNELYSQGFLM
ncbi:Microtubule-binding protein MIP-T3 [Spironucleus salmonicida]|uniref:Microtubule-binding protein MIP-T3 n=1 Tax=Spironucleus salmonicida TaxID=348837 RepID=V6LW52_9EUKA|nr:Microtubule-binding protein MIP-T3 [Spironucleus salmonicida]|eukprot:EST48857.1 hypothetical protein SS50377_10955 [Spironucleus salmonicida]